jgi:hypothetical protein
MDRQVSEDQQKRPIGDSRDSRGVAEAQAGGFVDNATHLQRGFGLENSNKALQFWYHE